MVRHLFVLTSIERVAIETIREERIEVMTALLERLARVLDDLAQTYQGWVVTAIEAEDLLRPDICEMGVADGPSRSRQGRSDPLQGRI